MVIMRVMPMMLILQTASRWMCSRLKTRSDGTYVGNNRIQSKVIGGSAGQTAAHNGGNVDLSAKNLNVGFPHVVSMLWLTTGIYWYIDGEEYIRDEDNIPLSYHFMSLTRELNSGVKDNPGTGEIPSNGVKRPRRCGICSMFHRIRNWAHSINVKHRLIMFEYLELLAKRRILTTETSQTQQPEQPNSGDIIVTDAPEIILPGTLDFAGEQLAEGQTSEFVIRMNRLMSELTQYATQHNDAAWQSLRLYRLYLINAGFGTGTGTGTGTGESAYDTWQAQPGNAGKTEAEFIADITGTDGADAYDLWLQLAGNAGKTPAQFIASLVGDSFFETWLTQPGNSGKSFIDLQAELSGVGKISGNVLTDTDTITLNIVNTLDTSTAPTVITEDGTDYNTAGFTLPDGANGDSVLLAIGGPNYPRLITSKFSGYTSNTEVFLNTNSSLVLLTWRDGVWSDFISPAQGGGGTGGSGDVTTAQLDDAVAAAQSARDAIELANLPIRQFYVYDTLTSLNAVDRHSPNAYALVVENDLVLKSNGVDAWAISTVTNLVAIAANQQVAFSGNLTFEEASPYLFSRGGVGVEYREDAGFVTL